MTSHILPYRLLRSKMIFNKSTTKSICYFINFVQVLDLLYHFIRLGFLRGNPSKIYMVYSARNKNFSDFGPQDVDIVYILYLFCFVSKISKYTELVDLISKLSPFLVSHIVI